MNVEARFRRCVQCKFYRTNTTLSDVGRCIYGHSDLEKFTDLPECDGSFWYAPTSVCPANFWRWLDEEGATWDLPARINACNKCPYGRSVNRFDPRLCLGHTGVIRPITSALIFGSPTGCPRGTWDNLPLTPVNPPRPKRSSRTEQQVTHLGPLLSSALYSVEDKEVVLSRLENDGFLMVGVGSAIMEAIDNGLFEKEEETEGEEIEEES